MELKELESELKPKIKLNNFNVYTIRTKLWINILAQNLIIENKNIL